MGAPTWPPICLGIELGGTKAVCAVGTGPTDIRAETHFATTTPEETLARAVAFFRDASAHEPIAAVGVASFGPLDLDPGSPTFGSITTTPKHGWPSTPLVAPLHRALGVPIAVETDVNAAALAEHRWGAGRGVDPVVYVTVGTGIGGGAVVNGRVLHGLVHPEIGHVRIPRQPGDSFAGVCGYHGDCLEGLASAPAIAARWRKAPESLPDEHPAWALEAQYLALGLVGIVSVLSPRRIIVGGGVMRRTGLLSMIRARVVDLLGGYVPAAAVAKDIDDYIVAPGLGDRSGVLGAIAVARDAIADDGVGHDAAGQGMRTRRRT